MFVWETDRETCLHQCWGQQEFGRSSAFVGGGEETGTRESGGWRRKKREDFVVVPVPGQGGDGRVTSGLIGFGLWWGLTLRAYCLSLSLSLRPLGEHQPGTFSSTRGHEPAGGSHTRASRRVIGSARAEIYGIFSLLSSLIKHKYGFWLICSELFGSRFLPLSFVQMEFIFTFSDL